MTENRLAGESSPYLRQHRDNPVHWQPWDKQALERAKAEDKPILLSIGYAACHWCHVMAHESFEDPAIAEVMNDLFVNIKVDREERPDIDSIYQSALAMMGEHGGWPLTMFLTPDREPFWGGTYFPSTARYGRPAFPDLLHGIEDTYRNRRDSVTANVTSLRDGLAKVFSPEGGGQLTLEVLDQAASGIMGAVDVISGGTQGAPKFPQPSLFQLLWRAYKRTGLPQFRDGVTITLDNICQGGIYDHLGGGFARYATDDVWLAPHFEKMLYDNAQLLELMTDVWLETRSPLYQARIRETIEWALREMRDGVGDETAFVSAYDADSEGEEGKFYVWSEEEIDAILGSGSAVFKQAYDVSAGGNWEGKTILNRSHELPLRSDAEEDALSQSRGVLLARRGERIWPGRDDKILADWNGLMIAALARAAAVFEQADWLAAAKTAYTFIVNHMTENSRLHHVWCDGQAHQPAVIDDYANMARAALYLFESTGEDAYRDQAEAWVATADKHYWDTVAGGYFLSADDTDDVIARPKTAQDNAVPPGNGTMVEVLARLFHITGNRQYRDRADGLIAAVTDKDTRQSVHQQTLLNGFEILERAVQVVVVGDTSGGEGSAFRRAAIEVSPPTRILTFVDADTPLPEGHPAHAKGMVGGKTTVYICVGATCGLPLTDATSVREELAAL
jgi:uncharacterized protein YyaL (SSP411 family)